MCLSFDDNLGFQKIFLLLSLSFFNFYFLVSPWYVKVYFFVYWDFQDFLICGRKMLWRVKNSIIVKFCLSFILFLFCFSLSLCIYIWPSSRLHEVLFCIFSILYCQMYLFILYSSLFYLYLQWAPLFLNYETFLCITIQLLNLFICITGILNDQYFFKYWEETIYQW